MKPHGDRLMIILFMLLFGVVVPLVVSTALIGVI